jgi:O-antigen ligase
MTLQDRFWAVLLVMCVIQFSGAWIYPSAVDAMAEALSMEKKFGVPYQYMLWALIPAGLMLLVHRLGFESYYRVIRLVLPYWIIGLIAGLFGFGPISSIRALILWGLMATAATCTATSMPTERTIKLLCGTLAAAMILSVLLALAVPRIGTQAYGASMVWRGAFFGKNVFGWVAALTMVISMAAMRPDNLRWTRTAAVLGFICLAGSQSKGAAVAAVVTVGYLYLIRWFSRRLSPGFAVFSVLALIGVAAISGFLVMPALLEMLGRDMTLTGRTDVWRLFFNSMIKSPWLGEGPGAYSALSPLTAPLAARLESLGTIVTPHNVFLGVFGDTGLFGLCAFILTVGYLTVVLPLYRPARGTFMCAAVGFLIMAHGLVETHEVLAPGLGWFLLVLSYALSIKERKEQLLAPTAPVAQAVVTPQAEMRYAARRIG